MSAKKKAFVNIIYGLLVPNSGICWAVVKANSTSYLATDKLLN